MRWPAKPYTLALALLCLALAGQAQPFSSSRVGSPDNLEVRASGGLCLMGGAAEDDQAMRWFLQQANGGDVLVLRTTGSDGYNSYFYDELGVALNSVETMVCHGPAASTHPYVLQRIAEAEAIWITGGDQWEYLSLWRNTAFIDAVNEAIRERNAVIGGTSAGMAVQGQFYFSAENGTIQSASALADPFDTRLTVDSAAFLDNAILRQTITDTHFDNPDRKGRLTAFLARIQTDYQVPARAIACDEYTAVCIDTLGIARVYGGYPAYDDRAYFIQSNCELDSAGPEICAPSNPLTWDRGGKALAVYAIQGESTGSRYFDLNTWKEGSGGSWQYWSAVEGTLEEREGEALDCEATGLSVLASGPGFSLYPNPSSGKVWLRGASAGQAFEVYNSVGQRVEVPMVWVAADLLELDLGALPKGWYAVRGEGGGAVVIERY